MASEAATTPLPALWPAALPELVAELNALVDRQNVLLSAGNREVTAFRREIRAAGLGRELGETAFYEALDRVADRQLAARNNFDRIAELGESIRRALTLQTLMEVREAELAAEPEPVRRPHRKPTAREERRHLRLEHGAGGIAGVAAFRGLRLRPPPLHALLGHKVLLTAGAGSAIAIAAVATMPASHTLQDITGIPWHAPAAISENATPVTLPSWLPTDAYVRPEQAAPKRPVVTLASSVPAPVVTDVPDPDPAPDAPSSWSGSSQTTLSSQLPQLSQSSGWQARGKHAAPDSPPGDSGYQGRHDGSGQSGQQQNAGWQGGQQQANGHGANWQAGSQQGTNWQGSGQQDSHGQQGNHGGR
jgi:hypothetical protein